MDLPHVNQTDKCLYGHCLHKPEVARDSSEGAAHTKDAKDSPATITETWERICPYVDVWSKLDAAIQ
jgi:hypothetical protein